MKWTRKPPNRPGYYLRLNAGHTIQVHHIMRSSRGKLKIDWGWSGEEKLMDVKGNPKLKGWQWYGPIPHPPSLVAYEE